MKYNNYYSKTTFTLKKIHNLEELMTIESEIKEATATYLNNSRIIDILLNLLPSNKKSKRYKLYTKLINKNVKKYDKNYEMFLEKCMLYDKIHYEYESQIGK